MKAVVTTLDEDNPLLEKEIPLPNVDSHDVLVKINASGMNPVDVKQLELAVAAKEERVLGFDGVGEVVSIGTDVKNIRLVIASFSLAN